MVCSTNVNASCSKTSHVSRTIAAIALWKGGLMWSWPIHPSFQILWTLPLVRAFCLAMVVMMENMFLRYAGMIKSKTQWGIAKGVEQLRINMFSKRYPPRNSQFPPENRPLEKEIPNLETTIFMGELLVFGGVLRMYWRSDFEWTSASEDLMRRPFSYAKTCLTSLILGEGWTGGHGAMRFHNWGIGANSSLLKCQRSRTVDGSEIRLTTQYVWNSENNGIFTISTG